MAQWRPKLDAVLRHRKHREEQVQQEFAEVKSELLAQEEKLRKLRRELQETLCQLREKHTEGISPDEIDLYDRFIKRQHAEMETQHMIIRGLNEQYEAKREILSQAVQEKKVIEKIQDTHRKAFLKDLDKKQQDILDEIAGKRKRQI